MILIELYLKLQQEGWQDSYHEKLVAYLKEIMMFAISLLY